MQGGSCVRQRWECVREWEGTRRKAPGTWTPPRSTVYHGIAMTTVFTRRMDYGCRSDNIRCLVTRQGEGSGNPRGEWGMQGGTVNCCVVTVYLFSVLVHGHWGLADPRGTALPRASGSQSPHISPPLSQALTLGHSAPCPLPTPGPAPAPADRPYTPEPRKLLRPAYSKPVHLASPNPMKTTMQALARPLSPAPWPAGASLHVSCEWPPLLFLGKCEHEKRLLSGGSFPHLHV